MRKYSKQSSLLTNESYVSLKSLYGLNKKLFEFEIQAKKDAKIQAKNNSKQNLLYG